MLTAKRLRRLVAHRARLERLQEGRLAEALQLRAERERAVMEWVDRRTAHLGSGAPATGAVEPGDLLASAEFSRRLEREIGARRAALAHSDRVVEAERIELLARRQARKAMEALLDRRLAEEREQVRREEVTLMDEAGSVRWAKRPQATEEAHV